MWFRPIVILPWSESYEKIDLWSISRDLSDRVKTLTKSPATAAVLIGINGALSNLEKTLFYPMLEASWDFINSDVIRANRVSYRTTPILNIRVQSDALRKITSDLYMDFDSWFPLAYFLQIYDETLEELL